jgi:hypothetical protein
LNHHRVESEFFLELTGNFKGIRAGSIAFIDESDSGDVVAFELTVYGYGLGLNASHGAQHENRSVEDPQRPLDFNGEVNVSGRIDEVNGIIFPLDLRRRGLYGDASFPFQFHVVHRRADAVFAADFVNGVNFVAEKQYAFRQGRFPRIDMRADSDVPHLRNIDAHLISLLLILQKFFFFVKNFFRVFLSDFFFKKNPVFSLKKS